MSLDPYRNARDWEIAEALAWEERHHGRPVVACLDAADPDTPADIGTGPGTLTRVARRDLEEAVADGLLERTDDLAHAGRVYWGWRLSPTARRVLDRMPPRWRHR